MLKWITFWRKVLWLHSFIFPKRHSEFKLFFKLLNYKTKIKIKHKIGSKPQLLIGRSYHNYKFIFFEKRHNCNVCSLLKRFNIFYHITLDYKFSRFKLWQSIVWRNHPPNIIYSCLDSIYVSFWTLQFSNLG